MKNKILIVLIPIILVTLSVYASNKIDFNNKFSEIIESNIENEEEFLKSISNTVIKDNCTYILTNTKKELLEPVTKEIKKVETIKTQTDNKDDILKLFHKELEYAEGKFTGTLKLSEDTLKIKTIKNGTYDKVYTLNKEYTNLDNNDLNNIPKEISNTSITYILTNCNWEVIENENIANISIPKKYKAQAIYKGIKKQEYPDTYECEITYIGNVSKKVENNVKYILTYTKLVEEEKTSILPFIGSAGVFILIIFIIFPNAKITNYVDGKYKILTYIKVSKRKPKVNLKYFPNATTNIFKIEFSRTISKKLQNEFITIITPNNIIRKKIFDGSISIKI